MTKIYTLLLVSCIVLGILYIFFVNNFSIPAQAADVVIRPLIGNKETIALESWYFEFNDKLDRIEYNYRKPDANIFTSSITDSLLSQKIPASNAMDLQSLSLENGFSSLPQEGIWQIIQQPLFPNQAVLAKTFVRPDSSRPYAMVSLVKMNMKNLSIGLQAGTYYPGGIYGMYGLGFVPTLIQQSNSLVAIFNGGFMAKDGYYGMVLDNKTYVPLRNGLATLIIFSDGTANIIDYQGQKFNNKVTG